MLGKNISNAWGLVISAFLLLILITLIGGGIYLYSLLSKPGPTGMSPLMPKSFQGQKHKVKVYFGSPDSLDLLSEEREIYLTEREEDQIKQVIHELIKGPVEDLTPVLPAQCELREVFIADRVAYLDFSRTLKENHPGGSTQELVTVYGIVNTIVDNFNSIDMVQLLIEGQEVDTLAGHINTDRALSRRQLNLLEGS